MNVGARHGNMHWQFKLPLAGAAGLAGSRLVLVAAAAGLAASATAVAPLTLTGRLAAWVRPLRLPVALTLLEVVAARRRVRVRVGALSTFNLNLKFQLELELNFEVSVAAQAESRCHWQCHRRRDCQWQAASLRLSDSKPEGPY